MPPPSRDRSRPRRTRARVGPFEPASGRPSLALPRAAPTLRDRSNSRVPFRRPPPGPRARQGRARDMTNTRLRQATAKRTWQGTTAMLRTRSVRRPTGAKLKARADRRQAHRPRTDRRQARQTSAARRQARQGRPASHQAPRQRTGLKRPRPARVLPNQRPTLGNGRLPRHQVPPRAPRPARTRRRRPVRPISGAQGSSFPLGGGKRSPCQARPTSHRVERGTDSPLARARPPRRLTPMT
jgi:hypothetical protein